MAGAAAGLSGAVFTYSKGSVFPGYVSIPHSVDALLMVLLGGVQTMAGPIVGALAYTGLYDGLLRCVALWRLVLGAAIVLLVLAFPEGIAGAVARRWPARRDRAGGRRAAQGVRRRGGGGRRVVRGGGRRDAGADRAERRRQVHLLQHGRRPVAAGCRQRARWTGRTSPGCAPRRICRLGVGRTFQITATFASMTARENVQLALMAHRRRTWRWWRPASRAAPRRDALLAQVGLREQAHRAAGVLAYGDLKRLELAIALAADPRLLLMDEPTAGMAPRERVALMQLVRRSPPSAAWRCCSPSTTWTWCSASPTASSCSPAAS